MGSRSRALAAATISTAILASCGANGTFDPDMRGIFSGPLDTAEAAAVAQPRPQPDQRGLISYPDYQVAVARQGDTVSTIAARLGLNANELAQHNAIEANAELVPGAVVVLPRRVAGGAPAAGAVSSTGQVSDPYAGQANRPAGAAATAGTTTPSAASGPQPRQHQVATGETAWSIARRYNVSVADLASWNGLPADMTIRVGQRLLIPVAGQSPQRTAEVVTTPGSGSPTPRPPSAAEPLPAEKTEPAAKPVETPDAPNMGASRTQASGGGRFQMPVTGSIIRTYEKGRNDGIDLSAPQGTTVKAAGSGTVAAVTRDTDGVPIVVIRHSGDLMTVYAGLDNLQVAKGATVNSGQAIGTSAASGILHFEVRRGFDSVDPEDYLN